jgi:hypothetical protein
MTELLAFTKLKNRVALSNRVRTLNACSTINPSPLRRKDRWPFCLNDCRTNSIFCAVLAVLIRPLRPLFTWWQVHSSMITRINLFSIIY